MQTQYLLKNIYLDIFCCPICRTALQSHSQEGTEQGIVNGYFFCRSCAAYYPILEGIPFFFAQPVWEKLMTNDERCKALSLLEGKHSADTPAPSARQLLAGSNWEYQFGDAFAVTQQALADPENFWGEKAFFSFCGLTPQHFFNNTVGIFCGGSGREAYHACRAGASLVLVMDIGGHINRIPTICAEHLDSLLLIRCDASTPPLVCDILDISICDHALQHIEKKDLAYANMTHCTKNQGIISVCVYSYENNKIMTHVIEPLKKIFHRLPIPFLNFIARMPAFILFCYTKILLFFTTRFVPEKLRVKFPYYELMRLWIPGGFSKFHEACFDLMHAPISYHFQEHEMRALADANGLTIQTLALINRTMWSMVCIKPTSRQ